MVILLKVIYRLKAISHQNSSGIIHRTRKYNPEDPMEAKTPKLDKAILSRKNKAGGIAMSDFTLPQSHSDRDSTTVAQQGTHSAME